MGQISQKQKGNDCGRKKSCGGFIALISIIIISIILLGLATTLGESTLSARFDALNSEYKRISLGLAESCVNTALLKIAKNYSYAPPIGGETVTVGANNCTIKSAVSGSEVSGKKIVTITTQARYPPANGAWSSVTVRVTAQNPTFAPVAPLPTCSLVVSPTSVPSGKPATLLWGASLNTVSFSLDHGIGPVTPVQSGSFSITPGGTGAITYTGTATNSAGGSAQCSTTVTVTPPPPAPSCADTVMILDRTGSMGGSDLANEKTAANSLVTLYSGVSPSPQVGAGSFGGLDGSAAGIPTNPPSSVSGLLTTTYGNLTSAINLMMGSNSSVGSNLAAAITVANNELNSARHQNGKQKVLIMVSDGEPNRPNTLAGNTNFLSPSANVQNGSGDFWNSPTNAYADGGGDSSDSVTPGNRHRFYNFNFPTLPSGATIAGMEANADTWVTAAPENGTVMLAPSSAGTYDQWTANTGTKISAVASNDGDSSYIDTAAMIESFAVPNANVPAGSTINSVTITAIARGALSGAAMQLVTEKGGNVSIGGNLSLTTNYQTYTRVMTTDPSTGNGWTLAEVNGWTTKFGVRTIGGASIPRVTQLYVTVSYSATGNSGYASPAAEIADTGGDGNGFESNPSGAFTDGGNFASNVNGAGDRHRFYNYNLNIPAGATITGIEVRPDWWLDSTSGTNGVGIELSYDAGAHWTAVKNETTKTTNDTNAKIVGGPTDTWGRTWSLTDFSNANFRVRIITNSSSSSRDFYLDWLPVKVYYTLPAATLVLAPSALGVFNQWTVNTGTEVSAVASNDGDSSYIDTAAMIESFAVPNANVPAGSTINSVTITAVAKNASNNATIQPVAEKGAGGSNQSIGPDINLTGFYTAYTRTMTLNPFTGSAWTLAEVNGWTTRFGVRTAGGTPIPRVTQLSVTVDYTSPPAVSCQLGMDLSWNGGTSWSSEKTQTLTGSETTYTLGNATDDWSSSHTWQASELSNANFRARVHAIDPGSSCSNNATIHLDWLQLKVHYSQPADPALTALNAADAAKIPNGTDNLPTDIFTIHFGDVTGRDFLAELASGVTAISGHEPGSYNDAGTSSNQSAINAENADGDNFFISPTSADMQNIFQTIGLKVCPAAAPECSNTIDDDGDGLVDTADPGCHSDGNAANSASYDSADNDEWSAPPVPPAPPPPPPPANVTIGSWQEIPK